MNGHTIPAPIVAVLAEVAGERLRQEAKWGQQDHPDVPGDWKVALAARFGIATADAARKACEDAFRRGVGSYGHIFVEEVCEAIEDAGNPDKLRVELIQVAAVAVQWIEKIDRDMARVDA